MRELLTSLGLAHPQTTELYAERCRDREVPAYIDRQSGVIFLGEAKDQAYYEHKDLDNDGFSSRTEFAGNVFKTDTPRDSERRYHQFRHLTRGKAVCDFGTGHGLYLDLLLQDGCQVSAIEAREVAIERILQRLGSGVTIVKDIDQLGGDFDVITCFHVLEHLDDPIGMLRQFRAKLNADGLLVVEVPHANDFLLKSLDLQAFREFTLWSEHLILHTRQSLERFLLEAGFSEVTMRGHQRYGLENHLYWLRHGKPGGHRQWSALHSPQLNQSYAQFLSEIDQTDTLIAIAKV